LPQSQREEVIKDLHACHEHRPELAMVDSAKGITNFHSPNDIIVDASMPAMIRNGGKMWGADGRLKDVKAVMPESTFARIYQEMTNFRKWNGNFDPKTMGTVPNVGLMAQQAEEYGSHDKTVDIPEDGVANLTDLATGEVLLSQNVEENHLRWDSLGEFLALAVSLEDLGNKTGNNKAKILAKTLDAATGKLLDNNKNPSPKTGQLDNRGSQFYLTLYWAQELAAQTADPALQAHFAPLAKALAQDEQKIVAEFSAVQRKPADIGGYYIADPEKTNAVMRPSATFNAALKAVHA